MPSSETAATINRALGELVSLQLFKSWNVFATRMFYFAAPGLQDQSQDGDYRLTIECPWRIEQHQRILVGSDDYGLRAVGNEDPAWDRREMQWGHLQDQKLETILGESRVGSIYNTKSDLVVQSVEADALGGFHLRLSGEYILSIFPASANDMEWLLSSRVGRSLALVNGALSQGKDRRIPGEMRPSEGGDG